jgi:hypothetical protein
MAEESQAGEVYGSTPGRNHVGPACWTVTMYPAWVSGATTKRAAAAVKIIEQRIDERIRVFVSNLRVLAIDVRDY